jgi:hypothetical protein
MRYSSNCVAVYQLVPWSMWEKCGPPPTGRYLWAICGPSQLCPKHVTRQPVSITTAVLSGGGSDADGAVARRGIAPRRRASRQALGITV